MPYRIEFASKAERDFKALDKPIQSRLARRIDFLADNPFPQGIRKLTGEEDLYRLRVGNYRIIYQVQGRRLVVLIVGIGHRADVYRGLRR